MELNEDIIKTALKEAQPDIIAGIKKELQDKMMQHIIYSMETEIEAEVKRFVADEVVPEIRKSLEVQKPEIISAATTAAIIITKEMIVAITTKAKSNMQGYRGSEILKRLME